jgi:hypothetical protein
MQSADWAVDAARYIQGAQSASDAFGGPISGEAVRKLLTATGAPLIPASDRLEYMATVIRGLRVGLSKYPARDKRKREHAISTGLSAMEQAGVPAGAMREIREIIALTLPPEMTVPGARRWHRAAAVLAALYFNEVNPETGWSREGPAARFIEKVLARLLAPAPAPSRAAIAAALVNAGMRTAIGNLIR